MKNVSIGTYVPCYSYAFSKVAKNFYKFAVNVCALAFILISSNLLAQDHSCAIHEELEAFKKENPEKYAKGLTKYNRLLDQVQLKSKVLKNNINIPQCPNGITVIPIAFHIFHDGTSIGQGYNFSESDLRRVVDQLNTDFSGYSILKEGISSEFSTFESGHTCIQFSIGRINRINSWSCPDYKDGATHRDLNRCLPGGSGVGSDNDPNDYLNVYVTSLSNGLLGVASAIPPLFGRVNGNDDGVTMNRKILIPGKSEYTRYNKGAVLTHEIGHWLGLPHVNGDINGAGCNGDDGFTDTYPQNGQQYYHCSNLTIPVSCNTVDNVFNHMDYSADCSKLMFTQEQSIAMQMVLNSSRVNLSTSHQRGNTDSRLFNVNHQNFSTTTVHSESINFSCQGSVNLLEYQNKWYPSGIVDGNTVAGTNIFYWENENYQVIDYQDLLDYNVVHNGKSNITLTLYVKSWNGNIYSTKKAVGQVLININSCNTPVNDKIEKAISILPDQGCQNIYSIHNATPTDAINVACSNYLYSNDVWFIVTAPQSGSMTIDVRSDFGHPPVIEAFTSTMSCLGTAENTLMLTGINSGQKVYVRAIAQNNENQFMICTSMQSATNYTCQTAMPLEVSQSCQIKTFSNRGATASNYPSNDLICGRTNNLNDVWYSIQVPFSGNVSIESFQVANGVTEVIMEAYSGTCGQLEPIACSSIKEYWPAYDRHARIELENRQPGEIIYIRLLGNGVISSGEYGLCVTETIPQSVCKITLIEPVAQSDCDPTTVTYTQTLRVHYRNYGHNEYLYVNNQAFAVTGSPQLVTLEGLVPDGKKVNVSANIGNSSNNECWQQSFYRSYNLFTATDACYMPTVSNDDCIGAIELGVNESCERQYFSSIGATHTLGISDRFSCGYSGHEPRDVWFKVRVPANGSVNISSPLLFNGNNMIFEVYEGYCWALSLIDCDQFSGPYGSEVQLINRQPGEYLYIRVTDYADNTQGDFAMCVTSVNTNGFADIYPDEMKPDFEWYFDEHTGEIEIMYSEAPVWKEETPQDDTTVLSSTDVNIYPNPTADYLHVSLQSQHTVTISLYDISGRIVKTVDINNSEIKGNQYASLDVRDVNTGQYFLKVHSPVATPAHLISIVR